MFSPGRRRKLRLVRPRSAEPPSPPAGDVIREHRPVGTRARRAQADDIEELIRLAGVMLAAMGHDPSPEDWRQAARDLLPHDFEVGTKAAFVIDHPDVDGRLVASAAGSITQWFPTVFNVGGRYGYVQWVATDPGFRRQGYSRAAMSALLDWFRDHGVPLVDLRATPEAESLYRSLGFTDVDTPLLRLKL
jgi:GNAT superfamily N-acetyltransferase